MPLFGKLSPQSFARRIVKRLEGCVRSMGFKSGFDLEFCIFEDLADRPFVAFNITDGDGLPHCMAVGGR